jgi:hypothetical protein
MVFLFLVAKTNIFLTLKVLLLLALIESSMAYGYKKTLCLI